MNDSVQVALRIRPLVSSEITRGSKDALDVYKELKQVRIRNSEKAFTFNYVAGCDVTQEDFYVNCVKRLVPNLFEGYNVTILAYGQTGSGKTHSMGTTYNGEGEQGVIPRALSDIFTFIRDNFSYEFRITVSFVELYQETLFDLLTKRAREDSIVELREDVNKGIILPNLTEVTVESVSAALHQLQLGSKLRVTGSTNMNSQSSRSHAIFTINIAMHAKEGGSNRTAKFHLVDLAGSERPNKTGATGQTFKEGININKGLLALGNVISALGEDKSQSNYIPYRDSSLTRLLKDSLGGNSVTLMIACVSPADYNIDETLSTLRYANRAKNIKNKPVVNEDPKTAEIMRLQKLLHSLQLELAGQGVSPEEVHKIKREVEDLRVKNKYLSNKLSTEYNEKAVLLERILMIQCSTEQQSEKLDSIVKKYSVSISNLNAAVEHDDKDKIKEYFENLKLINSEFEVLEQESKMSASNIKDHERQAARRGSDGHGNLPSESDVNERQESYTAQQMAMNTELQEVNQCLAQKEDLVIQMISNARHMVDTEEMAECQAKIAALEKEKLELVQQLKNVHSGGGAVGKVSDPHGKIAETRRKRVQELEEQLKGLNRKVQEQGRLIKLKEVDDKKIIKLNTEIQGMKAAKVKLIHKMRQEADGFRMWKKERERQLCKFKDQDRRRQNQIVRMELIHNKQQNVLKRKVQEAAAINKRLKDALALRKAAQDTKMSGKIERLGPWIQRELDVFVNIVDAKATLEILLEDRATLTSQLEELQAESQPDGEQVQQLTKELELRSHQIHDLQQKVLDNDDAETSKTRFNNIQTMAEAKYTIQVLFDLTAEIRRKEVANENKLLDLQSTSSETINALEETIRNCQDRTAALEAEYEKKIAILLRQLRGIEVKGIDEEMYQRCEMQQKTIQRLEEELRTKQEEIDVRKKKIELINCSQQMVTSDKAEEEVKTPVMDLKLTRARKMKLTFEDVIPDTPLQDDVVADPDWRNTPLYKQFHNIRQSESVIFKEVPPKRNSRGGCTCRGNCERRTCGCRKTNKTCSESCKCSHKNCVNRNSDNETENINPNEEQEDQEVRKKRPRTLTFD